MSPALATHFLLDRRAGWRDEPALSTEVQYDGPLRLQPLPGAPQPLTDPSGTFGGLTNPIGVAAGPDGTLVILDRGGTRVLRYDPCDAQFAPVACVLEPGAGPSLDGAQDLAVTRAGDVAIADTGNRRVLLLVGCGLAVRRIGGPWTASAASPASPASVAPVVPEWTVPASGACATTMAWPNGTWRPWGIAAWLGGLVVSDHANGLVHFLGGCLRWLRASDGSGQGAAPLTAPTAIAADRHGYVFVLQQGQSTVRVLDRHGAYVADLSSLDARRRDFCPVAVAVAPDGDLCLAGAGGQLCAYKPVDDACWCPGGATTADAPVAGLAFDQNGDPVLVGGSQCCLVRMRNGAGYPTQGRFVTTALDSTLTGCLWHRVALRGCLPQGTNVRVDTLTAEAEMSPAEVLAQPDSRWETGELIGTLDGGAWDCLIRSDPGRYLWLSLTFTGDGVRTPAIDDVEVWFPRSTSASLLPRAFMNEPGGGDFLQRFLSIADSQRASITREIDGMAALFDPMASPAGADGGPDFLDWLAGWVGLAFDAGVPVARRRRLVRDAAMLYRLRGTTEGVRRFVSLFCGVRVEVLEYFRLRRWAIAGRARLGDTELFGPQIVGRLQVGEFSEIDDFALIDTDDPFHDPFLVYASRFGLLLLARASDTLLALAQSAAELAKPAHTQVDIQFVQPRQRVGIQSRVGIDTVVAEVPPPGQTGSAQLGQGVIVGADPRLGERRLAQVGIRSQIGVNTGLE
jgi:phage tail-like protein